MSEQSKQITEVIDLTEERFRQIAPSNINYEAEQGFAMQLLTNNAYLMKVALENKASLAQAITNVAAIGLSLNPAEKQAYLIPCSVKQDNKFVSKIFLEPSYMGLCKLATDSGAIEWVQANVVYSNDTFVDNGPGREPTHSYNAFSKDRGEFVGVYCVAKTHSGDWLTNIMTADEVNSVRDRSEAWKRNQSGPWKTDYMEMAKKTVVRQACKMWPRSKGDDRLQQAVHLSNENEGFEPIVNNPEIRDFTAEQKAFYDQLITNEDALGMYVFQQTTESGVITNLYHSFERPKGKMQQVVDGLYRRGESTFTDYLDTIAASTDVVEVKELVAELDDDAIALISSRLHFEGKELLREATQ